MIGLFRSISKSSIGSDGITVLFTRTESGSFSSERGIIRPDDIRYIASRVIKNAVASALVRYWSAISQHSDAQNTCRYSNNGRKNTRNWSNLLN